MSSSVVYSFIILIPRFVVVFYVKPCIVSCVVFFFLFVFMQINSYFKINIKCHFENGENHLKNHKVTLSIYIVLAANLSYIMQLWNIIDILYALHTCRHIFELILSYSLLIELSLDLELRLFYFIINGFKFCVFFLENRFYCIESSGLNFF